MWASRVVHQRAEHGTVRAACRAWRFAGRGAVRPGGRRAVRPGGRRAVRPGGRRAVRPAALRAAAGFVAMLVTWLVLAGCADPGSAGTGSGASDVNGSGPSEPGFSGSGPSGPVPDSGGATVSGTPGGPTEGVQGLLTGRTFLSTSVHGHDLVTGSTVRLTFQEKQITASAGCNTLFGDYRLADGTLVVQNMGGTEMGCSKPLMGQDDWLSGMLHAGLRVELDGDELALTGRGVTLHLTDRRVVNPDRPLEGTRWILDGMIAGTGPSATVSSVPQGLTPTLRIVDRTIHFFDGLNDYEGPVGPGGTITIGTDSVQITGDIGGSAVGCASGHTCSVDMSVLTQDFHYQITADRLTVTGTGRYADKGLMFVADDDAASSSGEAPGTTGAAPETTSPPVPASPAPVVTPGTVTIPTEGITERSLPGRHDSIPPQPTPESLGDPDQ